MSLYMIVERLKNGDAVPVYRRFRERGRLAPAGLSYLSNWVDRSLTSCFQLMETDDPALLGRWTEQWSDLVDFEIHEVLTSAQAFDRIEPRL